MSLTMPERVPEVATGPLTVPRAPKPPAVPRPPDPPPIPIPPAPPVAPASVPPIASPALPTGVPATVPAQPVPGQPATVPGLPATVPAQPVPGQLVPGQPAAVPGQPGSVPAPPGQPAQVGYPVQLPAACATSWGANAGAVLLVANIPANLCGAGAVRPAPVTAACTKQVDGAGLQAAVDAARPGDRICTRGSSAQRLKVTRSGTPQAPIVLLGDGLITIKGLSVNANNVVIGGLNLTGASAPGVELTGNGITLVNNTISAPRGGDGDGIRFFGTNLKILHNTVSDVKNLNGAHADCLQTFASDSPASQHVLIDSNRCEKIDNQCLIAEGPNSSAGDGSGKGRSSDIVFTHNYCDSQASQAVMIDDVQNVSITSNNIIGGNEKAFAFDNKSTGAKVRGNILGLHIRFEVGMDNTSKLGYLGPLIGGLP